MMTTCYYCEQKCGFNCETTIERVQVLAYGQTGKTKDETVFVCDQACHHAMMRDLRNPLLKDDIIMYEMLNNKFTSVINKLKYGIKTFNETPKAVKDANRDSVETRKKYTSLLKEYVTYSLAINLMIEFITALLARNPDMMKLYKKAKEHVHECMAYQSHINLWSKIHTIYLKDVPEEVFAPWGYK
jgi:hypothetical protein